MSNLKRYNMVISPINICKMTPDINGKYVKFDDIKVLLKPLHNSAMPSCQGCALENQSKICPTCSICARTRLDYWHERQ